MNDQEFAVYLFDVGHDEVSVQLYTGLDLDVIRRLEAEFATGPSKSEFFINKYQTSYSFGEFF